MQRQLQGDPHEVQAVHGHPARAVGLVEEAAAGQPGVAVENTDVVQSEYAALKNVPPLRILTIHPPGKVEHKLVEHPLQERQIAAAVFSLAAVYLENPP